MVIPKPMDNDVYRPPQPQVKSSAAPVAAGRVLVVDDDETSRTLISDWLSAYGHKITAVANGFDALAAVDIEKPDVILLDVMMPGMDGFAVCERLRANPATAAVPVLFLTALDERQDRLRGIRAGANDFLTKPLDLPDVLLRVRNAVRLTHLHNEVVEKFHIICHEQHMRESLLHMIVHDLRTPLAGLDGFLQLLQMTAGAKLEERPAHYLKQALHATNKLAYQIDLLLDIHRLEQGKMHVNLAPHDVTQLVQSAVEPLRPIFGNRRFHLELPHQPLIAAGDSGLLSRVLVNIVGNAVAFTSPTEGEILIRVATSENHVRIEVADNGPGIDPAVQEAIFEKFFQVGEHVRTRSSGLGLAFCKLAMDAQHGRIGVTSQLGAGSRFWFEVPTVATTS
jgi:two-component system, sensor histidine kinase and response regulator